MHLRIQLEHRIVRMFGSILCGFPPTRSLTDIGGISVSEIWTLLGSSFCEDDDADRCEDLRSRRSVTVSREGIFASLDVLNVCDGSAKHLLGEILPALTELNILSSLAFGACDEGPDPALNVDWLVGDGAGHLTRRGDLTVSHKL